MHVSGVHSIILSTGRGARPQPQLDQDAVCRRCLLKDKDKEPFLMSDDNEMDPGEVPAHLLALSQVEEMLIARVHLHLEAKRIRGLQY